MRLALILAMSGACWAQQYEIGGATGGGFVRGVPLTGAAGAATAGFRTGPAFGAVVGHSLYRWVSGEVRYSFLKSDLKLNAGGADATFSGMAHAIHYDLLLHPPRAHRRAVQPFAAVGGGMKLYRGTGTETAWQPLNGYAYLTRTQEVKPLVSAGGGVKVPLGERLILRVEVRDYITPFPAKVIAPAGGAKASGWLHQVVPMVGISYVF